LQPRGGIHEVTHDEAKLRRRRTNRSLTSEHSNPQGEAPIVKFVAKAGNHVGELQPCPYCPLGVVLVGDGGSPHCHNRVPDELLYSTAEPLDDLSGAVVVVGQGSANDLVVACLGERSEADEVGKQHGDEAPLVGIMVERYVTVDGIRGLYAEFSPALTAELVDGVIGCPAIGTNEIEWVATIATESAAGFVVTPAIAAHH
jgi:hypothetical protein